MDSAADLIRDLTEALIEAVPGRRPPVVDRALSWLTWHNEPKPTKSPKKRLETYLPRSIKLKQCNVCGDDIFFAVRQNLTTAGKTSWVPMCPYPIDSLDIILDAVSIDFINAVAVIVENKGGRQYLVHAALCSLTHEPFDPDVAEIWYYTTGSRKLDTIEALENLKKILEDTS